MNSINKKYNKPFYDPIYAKALTLVENDPSINRIYDDRGINITTFLDPLIKTRNNGIAIDIGCGIGQVTLSLSGKYENVIAGDISKVALKVVTRVAKKSNITNIHPVLMDAVNMPFRDDVFELVLCSGALEWVSVNRSEEESTKKLQVSALKEIQRILTNKGLFWLGIENRFWYRYFLGAIDHHSGLRFVPVLPRAIANFYSKLLSKRSYRNYLYTYWDLSKMLKESGLLVNKSISAFPFYSNPRVVIDLANFDQKKRFFTNLQREITSTEFQIIKKILGLHLAKLLFPNFIIIGSKSFKIASELSRKKITSSKLSLH